MVAGHGDRRARSRLCALFQDTLARLDPAERVRRGLAGIGSMDGFERAEDVTIIALGKAARAMSAGALQSLDERGIRVRGGCVVLPAEHAEGAGDLAGRGLGVLGSAHPIPDQRSVDAARALVAAVRDAPARGRILALMSGGGSALAALPAPGLSLGDKLSTTRALAERGLAIAELNAVRKHLSAIKGGRLAAVARARMTTLVSSDVVGDDMSTVASGPTLPDPSTFAEAYALAERALGRDALTPAVREHFLRGLRGELPDTPKHARPGDDAHLVAGTDALVDAARDAAEAAGMRAEILARGLTGEVAEVARLLAEAAFRLRARAPDTPVCIIAGGEPTIALPAHSGSGGRAQQLALMLARELAGVPDIHVMCVGSDGVDGNTRAAGAIVHGATWDALAAASVDGERALARCDAGAALAAVGASVVTGPTGVNHADLFIIAAGL